MKYVHEDYGEEYEGKRHKRKLWNLFILKNYFYQELGVDSRHFGKLVKRCSDYKYGRIKNLTDTEKKALELLLDLIF